MTDPARFSAMWQDQSVGDGRLQRPGRPVGNLKGIDSAPKWRGIFMEPHCFFAVVFTKFQDGLGFVSCISVQTEEVCTVG